jgi:hypothetical protein
METAFVITRVSWVVTQKEVPFGLEIARWKACTRLTRIGHSQRSRRARATAEVARVFTG